MASRLAESHVEAQARLQGVAVSAVERLWRRLPAYDRRNVDGWLRVVLPLVHAAQRQSVALTEAYIARSLERQPIGVIPESLIGETLRGVDPATVYERPFVTVWTALKEGSLYDDAVAAGLARAMGLAAFDVRASMRATAQAVQDADPGIYGYQRVANAGACEFCSSIDGAYVKSADAMALHNHCNCGLEPLTSPHPRAAKLPSGVAVRQHGEMGPVLVDPSHDFNSL